MLPVPKAPLLLPVTLLLDPTTEVLLPFARLDEPSAVAAVPVALLLWPSAVALVPFALLPVPIAAGGRAGGIGLEAHRKVALVPLATEDAPTAVLCVPAPVALAVFNRDVEAARAACICIVAGRNISAAVAAGIRIRCPAGDVPAVLCRPRWLPGCRCQRRNQLPG